MHVLMCLENGLYWLVSKVSIVFRLYEVLKEAHENTKKLSVE